MKARGLTYRTRALLVQRLEDRNGAMFFCFAFQFPAGIAVRSAEGSSTPRHESFDLETYLLVGSGMGNRRIIHGAKKRGESAPELSAIPLDG
jgi:hypothetical protein